MTDDFFVGALCALAVVATNDSDDCAVYHEIVDGFGLSSLIRVAKAEDDSQLPALLRIRNERRAKRRKASASVTPQSERDA